MTMITQIRTRKEQRKLSRKKRKRNENRRVEEPPADVPQSKNKSEAPSKPSKKEKPKKKKKSKLQESDSGNNYSSTLYETDPDLAEAIQRDEAEIAELEKRLGLSGGKKAKDKLHKEYSKLEGFGDDFGDFLDDLDALDHRLRSTENYPQDGNDDSEMEDEDDDEPPIVKEKPKKKARKADKIPEDSASYESLDPDVADALRRDDEEIAALEKKLGLSKRKEKDKLYKEYSKLEGYGDDFGDFLDGLDGMMSRLKQPDSEYQYDGSENSDADSEDDEEELVSMKGSDDELDEDDSVLEELERMQREEEEARLQSSQQENHSENESESDEASASDSDSDSGDGSDDEQEMEPDHDIRDTYRPSKGEDIYGNKIDSDPSENKKPTKYVPPHLRKKQQAEGDDEEEKERMRVISRSLNNSLNRLSEDTLISIAQQVAKLYSSNPTQMVHKLIWKNAKDVCIATPMLMTGLIPVYTACITGVHIQTGDTVQIGEFILEKVVVELLDRLKESREEKSNDENDKEIENKQICNLMLVLSYLYNYGIVHCSFIYDVIRHLIENFSEADVECLLILLSHCGRSLRSDDPTALKEIVLLVQKKKSEESKGISSSRTEYMVSAIMDLKNNKRKREDTVFTDKVSKFRKILGRVKSAASKMGVSKSTSEASLRITLKDIIQAETKGRWWKVGASWVGNQYRFSEDSKSENEKSDMDASAPSASNEEEEEDEELLKLASKFRMNTDRKRAIFCIIMGGTDIEDTFEKLCRSSMLQNRSERDTVRVLMECCGNEKSYNKFYGHLAARICEFQPQSKFSLQLAYWDVFKQFDSIGARKVANLAKLLFHLVVSHRVLRILPVIKTLDLSDDDLDESTLIFLTILLSSILEHFSEPAQAKAIFARSTAGTKKDEDADEGIRAGLLVFLMETLKSSPKNKKKSRFRKNFKAVVKELDTDGFEDMF